jgi:methanogenic corrinoid protein MtbC1
LFERIGSHTDQRQLVSIGQAVEVLSRDFPDVTHSSIRFLEREGLVTSTRTAGGHRLFSSEEIERVRLVKTWQLQRLSLEDIRQRLVLLDRLPSTDSLSTSFLALAVAGDPAAAYRLILDADNVGLPLIRLFGDVLQPALTELGHRWERGEISVAQEKEVSEMARDLIAELSVRHGHPQPAGAAVVAACVEGERHELGLRMICGMLRAHGVRVHYLGADVAPRFLLDAVKQHRPDLSLLSARMDANLTAVKNAIDVILLGVDPDAVPAIIVGGRVAFEHAATVSEWGAVPLDDDKLSSSIAGIQSILAEHSAAPTAGTGDTSRQP